VVLLIDLLFFSPPWTISIFPALGLSGTIAFGYWFWIEQCFFHNGWYVYFRVLPTLLTRLGTHTPSSKRCHRLAALVFLLLVLL
jgi:hypothetical protein